MTQITNLSQQKSLASDEVDLTGVRITGHNLLVQPVKADDKTETGVYLPDSVRDDVSYLNNVCKVLVVGPTAYTQDMFKGEAWCKEGDYVVIPKNVGQKLLLKGTPVTLVSCDRVIMVVDEPKFLDPKFNITTSH